MYFELPEALIDDILFAMEDQHSNFLLDTQEGMVVNTGSSESFKEKQGENRYVDMPKWDSSDGFRLMEHFAASFKNSIVQRELTIALDRGRGVFRAFKDVLNRYPEAEKRWFAFKEREMKRGILRWYNALRDEWGLERIGTEPEETDDLVLEDFIFREPEPKDIAAAEDLHRQILQEAAANKRIPIGQAETLRGDLRLIAETNTGDFTGYIGVIRKGNVLHISDLAVKPEFRGLGVGEALCSRLLELLDFHSVVYITLDLPIEAEGFSRVLLRELFKPYGTQYYKKLENE
ncbi:MAG: GNAT family N-acetyltransferase [Treponema sp.]|jgi:ribosomal protein S18 acetylase RimI-like enzyme|nr:GNAT family N-acetyltransferase [Treponema sp.]